MSRVIDPRMVKARSALVISQPFFGTLALHLEMMSTVDAGMSKCDTMCTDGKRLIYAPAFLDEINEPELRGVVAHEVLHCAYRHHTRRNGRDPELWNDAADYAINRDLLAAGFVLPKCGLFDHAGRFKDMGAERIYEILKAEKEAKEQQQQQQKQQQQDDAGQQPPPPPSGGGDAEPEQDGDQKPQPGAGKPEPDGDKDPQDGEGDGAGDDGEPEDGEPETGEGAGDGEDEGEGDQPGDGECQPDDSFSDSGRCGGIIDAAPESDPVELAAQDREWEVRVQQAIMVAQAGNIPGGVSLLSNAVKPGKADWRELLRIFIDEKIQQDYSWTKPNKRMLHSGFILPSIVPDGVSKIGVIFDTSGSTSRFTKAFIGEIQAAMDLGNIATLVTISCDTQVYNPQEFQAGDDLISGIKLAGNGGTRFAPAFKWFAENHPDCAAIIYFTDMECFDFGPEPACPVLWAAWGDCKPDVPFGEVIDLEAA